MRIPIIAALVALAAGPLAVPLASQVDPYEPQTHFVRATLENDFLAFRVPGRVADHDYTSGLAVEWVGSHGLRLALGQKLYTPRLASSEPVPKQRPYAGWLYGEVGHLSVGGERGGVRELSLAIGVIGPEALGEPVQNGFHDITYSGVEPGWDHQLSEGPTFLATATFAQPYWRDPGSQVALSPYQRVEAGTRRVALELGAEVLSAGSGPLGLPTRRHGLSGGVRLGVAWVPWDVVLDRPAAEGFEPLARSSLLAHASADLRYTAGRWLVLVRFTRHTKEYDGQHTPFGYGSVALTRLLSH